MESLQGPYQKILIGTPQENLPFKSFQQLILEHMYNKKHNKKIYAFLFYWLLSSDKNDKGFTETSITGIKLNNFFLIERIRQNGPST